MHGIDEEAGLPVLAVCGLAFEADVASGPGVLTVCGPGALRVDARLSTPSGAPAPWAGIISFGCAGALDPGLAPGSCVVASGVIYGGELHATDPAWTRALLGRLPGAWPGLLAGLDAPLASSADKARLWTESRACAVDMESHAAARIARRHGLPFAALRVVLDPAWRNIPACALAGMGTDGSCAIWPMLGRLARDPRQLAGLCALAREAWVARRSLLRARAKLGVALALPLSGAPD